MKEESRSDQLRARGLTPTIQRLAVLDCLEKTKKHPTADQVLAGVRETFPSVSRGTVYNTLEALTKAGIIQQITVDPAVARYDADMKPHAHFRCRICNTVYDIMLDRDVNLDEYTEGHYVEAVRAYAYGVCKKCLAKAQQDGSTGPSEEKLSKIAPPSNSPSESAQRSPKGFSNEPTKEVRDARAS